MTALVAAIASTVLLLGVATFLYLFALTFGSLLRVKPEAFVEDETADEVLEVDGPTSRPYIPAVKAKPDFHPPCFEAYCDRRYSDICKGCTPRMGVRP